MYKNQDTPNEDEIKEIKKSLKKVDIKQFMNMMIKVI